MIITTQLITHIFCLIFINIISIRNMVIQKRLAYVAYASTGISVVKITGDST